MFVFKKKTVFAIHPLPPGMGRYTASRLPLYAFLFETSLPCDLPFGSLNLKALIAGTLTTISVVLVN